MTVRPQARIAAALVCLLVTDVSLAKGRQHDPLPSWNEGAAKEALLTFVEAVTDESGKDFVPAAERIAVFDNDGTLWVEQPVYTQLTFVTDRVKEMAPEHPEWKTTQPFQGVIEGDMDAVTATGEQGMMELLMATHGGMTAEAYEDAVERWIATARHPRFDRRYTELVYQPQLELMDHLRAHGFKVFIVSGGGIQFMRPWADEVYGVPPEQVVGSSFVTTFELRDGEPTLVRQPQIRFIDDKEGKPVGIYEHIGRRPILAFGNSDGDLQMVQYTTAGEGPSLGLFLHHTDARREYAYDREGHVGVLDKSLDLAAEEGWVVVDMKKDWRVVFPK